MISWIISFVCLLTIQVSSSKNVSVDIQNSINSIYGTGVSTRDDGDCDCVMHYLCDNGTINSGGFGIFTVRIDADETVSSKCPHYLFPCCKKSNIVDKPIKPEPLPPRKGCGYRRPNGVGLQTIGDHNKESKFGEFPWMVAVKRHEDIGVIYQCGGALIHPKAVLTAAHCVERPKKYAITAGVWDTQTTLEIYPTQEVNVEKIIIHPKYAQLAGLHNDIALLILEKPIEYKDHIDVLCLPPQDYIVPDLTGCTVTGWGKDIFGKNGVYQVILKKIDVPIMERNKCEDTLKTTRLGRHFMLDKSFICAGGAVDEKDACEGDGGGPLVCPFPGQKERYFNAGIVAWGIDCGMRGIPGVYVNVALFRRWIDRQMRKNNLEITEYQY